ncbi:hypothetical protein A0J57_05485 [Sphingobium sp. 22B]|nr:hypothetical protein A0J57_05485 [Sphingobium sp. 22B]OAP32739.1 hypothetical protein A8O16_07600 [Sphingobium sp. 20006FA]
MAVATARLPDKPKKKSRPGTGRLLQNFNYSSNTNDNVHDWRVQRLVDHHHISEPLANVIATLIFGEARDV